MMHRIRDALLLIGLCTAALPAFGHPMAPSLLELREDGDRILVLWKVSRQNALAAELQPRLPTSCHLVSSGWDDAPAAELEDSALIRRWMADCGNDSLVGHRITVDGLDRADLTVLLRVVLADGQTARAVLQADAPDFVVPSRPSRSAVVGNYLVLGFQHILGGFDHLLFVLGLLFLIRGQRMLLLTVTAFTVGHSITLSLASLDLVRLPSGPVELAIAVSIWLLAWELTRQNRERSSWVGRRPWWIAGLFGLLHGFGFAGALTEAGLPANDIPLALLSFNLGIELGQIAFIVLVLFAHSVLAKLLTVRVNPDQLGERLRGATSYLIGILATCWCLQRGAELPSFF